MHFKKANTKKLIEKCTEFHRAKHSVNKRNNYFDYNVNSKKNRKFNGVRLDRYPPKRRFQRSIFQSKIPVA